MASQQTIRQRWVEEGFIPYNTIRQSAEVPEVFRKRSQWRNDPGAAAGYYSYTESEPNLFIPVEFDSDNYCWVEVRWITELESSIKADHWLAFQPAKEELGLDITVAECDLYITNAPSTPGSFRDPPRLPTPPQEYHHQQLQVPVVAQVASNYSPASSVHRHKNSSDSQKYCISTAIR